MLLTWRFNPNTYKGYSNVIIMDGVNFEYYYVWKCYLK